MKRRISSLTKRWMINVVLSIVIFLIVLNILIGWLSTNYYYNSIYSMMDAHLSIITENFHSYVRVSDDEFDRAAQSFAEDYENKHLFEVQIFSDNAQMLVSTTGFTSGESSFPDYEEAISNGSNRKGTFKGRLSSGEKVMSVTVALGNTSHRAVRMITSMEGADEQVNRIILLSVTVSLVLFIMVMLTGMIFLKSIVVPLRKVSVATKQIARGNFDTRIETDGKGDMGELCLAINEMATELGSSEQMKNDFISTVSHELRTPLTAIRGWSETVKYATDDEEIVKKGMEVISKESERLNTIVEDLLDFSRIQNGALSYDMKRCDINIPLSEVITAFKEAIHKAGLTVDFNPLPLDEVVADGTRLKQVFVNIIDNCIKNTESGGKISIYEQRDNAFVSVIIRDNGKGIPKQDLDKIKIKFFKSEANKTVRGSGIGLAIADEIIKAHNGILAISSEEGVGTVVRISLPNNQSI